MWLVVACCGVEVCCVVGCGEVEDWIDLIWSRDLNWDAVESRGEVDCSEVD